MKGTMTCYLNFSEVTTKYKLTEVITNIDVVSINKYHLAVMNLFFCLQKRIVHFDWNPFVVIQETEI
jgi:hypothetical protein